MVFSNRDFSRRRIATTGREGSRLSFVKSTSIGAIHHSSEGKTRTKNSQPCLRAPSLFNFKGQASFDS